jgi:hypothetical protein
VDDIDALLVDQLDHAQPEALNQYLTRVFTLATTRGWADRWRGSRLNPWFFAVYRAASGQRVPGSTLTLLCLDWFPGSVPGSDDKELLLITPTGDLCDSLICSVNSRYTRMWSGILSVDMHPASAPDFAQVVIHILDERSPTDMEWKWHYGLEWRGHDTRHTQSLAGRVLCRAAIDATGFRVLFPPLG